MIDSPSWILSSLLVVVPAILLCLGLLWLMRKCISVATLKQNHDVAGFTLGIIGVLYSVVLGFTVVNAQNRYTEVVQTIQSEAMTIADLYRDSGYFQLESRDAIRSALRSYVYYVIDTEWWLPAKKKIRHETQQIIDQIFEQYYKVPVPDEKTSIWYSESIGKLNAFLNARLARQFNSWEHLGAMMWTLLILGALITIGFMYFFGLELRSHMIMTALLTGYVSFMLFLVYSLDHLFEGPEGIKPTAFEQVVTLFDRWDNNSIN